MLPGEVEMENDDICEFCKTDHRDLDYSLTPCFDSIIGAIVINEALEQTNGRTLYL